MLSTVLRPLLSQSASASVSTNALALARTTPLRSFMSSSASSSVPKVVLTRKLPTSVLPDAAKRGEIELVKWDHEEKAADRSWLLENIKGASGVVVMLADKVSEDCALEEASKQKNPPPIC